MSEKPLMRPLSTVLLEVVHAVMDGKASLVTHLGVLENIGHELIKQESRVAEAEKQNAAMREAGNKLDAAIEESRRCWLEPLPGRIAHILLSAQILDALADWRKTEGETK